MVAECRSGRRNWVMLRIISSEKKSRCFAQGKTRSASGRACWLVVKIIFCRLISTGMVTRKRVQLINFRKSKKYQPNLLLRFKWPLKPLLNASVYLLWPRLILNSVTRFKPRAVKKRSESWVCISRNKVALSSDHFSIFFVRSHVHEWPAFQNSSSLENYFNSISCIFIRFWIYLRL